MTQIKQIFDKVVQDVAKDSKSLTTNMLATLQAIHCYGDKGVRMSTARDTMERVQMHENLDSLVELGLVSKKSHNCPCCGQWTITQKGKDSLQ